jgi:predicted RNase H-like HicB family nuclease
MEEDSMKLHVLIEKDEAGYCVAEIPALPGCLSQTNTREEALHNLKEAIEGWLEVMETKHAFDRTEALEVVVWVGAPVKLFLYFSDWLRVISLVRASKRVYVAREPRLGSRFENP